MRRCRQSLSLHAPARLASTPTSSQRYGARHTSSGRPLWRQRQKPPTILDDVAAKRQEHPEPRSPRWYVRWGYGCSFVVGRGLARRAWASPKLLAQTQHGVCIQTFPQPRRARRRTWRISRCVRRSYRGAGRIAGSRHIYLVARTQFFRDAPGDIIISSNTNYLFHNNDCYEFADFNLYDTTDIAAIKVSSYIDNYGAALLYDEVCSGTYLELFKMNIVFAAEFLTDVILEHNNYDNPMEDWQVMQACNLLWTAYGRQDGTLDAAKMLRDREKKIFLEGKNGVHIGFCSCKIDVSKSSATSVTKHINMFLDYGTSCWEGIGIKHAWVYSGADFVGWHIEDSGMTFFDMMPNYKIPDNLTELDKLVVEFIKQVCSAHNPIN
jgi:hypothetical protein